MSPDDMREEYDFSGGVRGKYFDQYWRWRARVGPRIVIAESPFVMPITTANALGDEGALDAQPPCEGRPR